MNRFFRLPIQTDLAALQHDLRISEAYQWKLHFNQQDYNGSWTSIALRSPTGTETDIYAHSAGGFADTPLLEKCLGFQHILQQLRCEKESVRLLCLAPGSEIKTHNDMHTGYEYGFFRLHVPICTDPDVEFCVDGTHLSMLPGECWYANFHLPHSVKHNGTLNRVHLVIDCIRNEWSDALFAAAGYDFEEERKAKIPDKETLKRMIEELALQNTDTARQLKSELETVLATV